MMSQPRRTGLKEKGSIDPVRYRRITWFFAGVIAHVIGWDILLRRIWEPRAVATRPERWRRLSRRFRELAVEMGGVMIKLGQFLSSRVDVLPLEITEELKGLQDEVPAVPYAEVYGVLVDELDDPTAHFAEIEAEPMAAASLGQVHRAWLRSHRDGEKRGAPVVVKVQRPGIVSTVQTDLAALRFVARWLMRYPPLRRRADVPALLEEFADTLWDELDYELEADNAERFARMFADSEGVYIPFVFRNHSTARVLVLENVEALKIIDVAGMESAGISRPAVASRLLDTYLYQILEEGFFHADPHPGNLFIRPLGTSDAAGRATDGSDGRPFTLIFVDFGMVGHIESVMGERLRELIVAITQRDARALTNTFHELGFFLPSADLDRITEAVSILLDELWGRNLLELSRPDPQEVQELSREFRDILFDFPFQVPQDFIYLGRAMGILSGLASLIDPQINPWYQVERFGRMLIRRRETRQAGWEAVVATLRPLLSVPGQLERVLTAAEHGKLRVEMTPDHHTARRLERIERRLTQLQLSLLALMGTASGLWVLRWLRGNDKSETQGE